MNVCTCTYLSYRQLREIEPEYMFLDSLVVRISACHVEGPGSIPGRGEFFFTLVIQIVSRTLEPG